jgi:hypothetical protein
MIKAIALQAQQPLSHAAQQNARYSNTKSMYFDAKDRFNTVLSNLPLMKQTGHRSQLARACTEFQKKYPSITDFQDLDLVQSLEMPLSDILIDSTIQRLLDLPWSYGIVENFRAVQAQPIQVYKITDTGLKYTASTNNGLYACWDGQHTLIAFYIIAVMILKLDPAKVMVPVNIYNVAKKSEIRENFVKGNGPEGKKLLEPIDYFMQMIYGVRVDGTTNPIWVEAELKQQYLEQADLFVTAAKFGDTHMPGAISRMQEIDKYSSDIIRKFALYTTTFPVSRPVASQEIEIMCAWFDMAKKDGVDYTDEEVVNLGNHLHVLFGADFHESSAFWETVRVAYTNWHKKYWAGWTNGPTRVSFSKNWNNGGVFLWHQLSKTWKTGRIPRLNVGIPFIPAQKDLY